MVCYGFTVVSVMFVMAMLDKDEHLLAHKTKNSLNNFMWEVQKTEFKVAAWFLQYINNLSQLPLGPYVTVTFAQDTKSCIFK